MLKQALTLLLLFAKMSLQQMMIYRLTSVMIVVFGVLSVVAEYLLIDVYYNFGNSIGDWNRNEFFILFGSFSCMNYLYCFFFEIGHDEFAYKVKYGELDYDLMRPVDSMFLSSFSRFDYPSLFNLLLPAYLIYSGITSEHIELGIWVSIPFVLAILLGTFVIYLLNHLLSSLFFWLKDFSTAFQIVGTVVKLGSKPLKIYPSLLQILFGFCVPIILAGNLPAEVVLGKVSWTKVLALLAGTVTLFVITRLVWVRGVAKYSSASS